MIFSFVYVLAQLGCISLKPKGKGSTSVETPARHQSTGTQRATKVVDMPVWPSNGRRPTSSRGAGNFITNRGKVSYRIMRTQNVNGHDGLGLKSIEDRKFWKHERPSRFSVAVSKVKLLTVIIDTRFYMLYCTTTCGIANMFFLYNLAQREWETFSALYLVPFTVQRDLRAALPAEASPCSLLAL